MPWIPTWYLETWYGDDWDFSGESSPVVAVLGLLPFLPMAGDETLPRKREREKRSDFKTTRSRGKPPTELVLLRDKRYRNTYNLLRSKEVS